MKHDDICITPASLSQQEGDTSGQTTGNDVTVNSDETVPGMYKSISSKVFNLFKVAFVRSLLQLQTNMYI